MVTQTIQFESISLSEVGSGAITAFLYDDATLAGTLASIAENGTLAGRYTGTVEDVAAGTYRLVVKVNDITVNDADEMVDLLLAVGTYVAYQHAALDTAASAQLQAIEDGVDANTGYLTSLISSLATLAGKFTGITLLADWLRRAFRSDAGTTGMAVAEAEIAAIGDGPAVTYSGITDNLEAIKDSSGGSTTNTIVTLQSVAAIAPGVIVGPTEPLVIGDDYLTSLGRNVRVNLLDSNGNAAVVVFGDKSLEDVDCSIELLLRKSGKPTGVAQITGTCTFYPAVGDVPPYLLVEFPQSETVLAVPGPYDMQAEARWGDGKNVTFAPYGQIEFVRDIQRAS